MQLERGFLHLEKLNLLDFLKVRREEVGLSQEEASRRMGVSSLTHYGHFERGTRAVQVEYIPPLANMLQVPVGMVLEKYFRHTYGGGEHSWIVDELYGPELEVAHKLRRLSEEEKKSIAVMVDLLLSKKN
nr:putative transcriptional regulator [uncultured bacterium]